MTYSYITWHLVGVEETTAINHLRLDFSTGNKNNIGAVRSLNQYTSMFSGQYVSFSTKHKSLGFIFGSFIRNVENWI